MLVKTYNYTKTGWSESLDVSLDSEQTLVIVFASSDTSKIEKPLGEIIAAYPTSIVVGSSSANEIYNDEVSEDGFVAAVTQFEKTHLEMISLGVDNDEECYGIGQKLASLLLRDNLKALFVLSEGLNVNGSKLTKGIDSVLPNHIPAVGGLAGDSDRFETTWVLHNKVPRSEHVSVVGFYGDDFHLAHAYKGGWRELGLERKVTKSTDNILYELDGEPALDIYKTYLGERANGLPGTGLLFPLSLRETDNSDEVTVRTILGINEEEHSITFAGDIPEGSLVTLMTTTFDRLVDAAKLAAKKLDLSEHNAQPLLCIAISCTGRQLVLKQRTEDELEAILSVLPAEAKLLGFYSYGEISPLTSGRIDLHNQTMTLSAIWET